MAKDLSNSAGNRTPARARLLLGVLLFIAVITLSIIGVGPPQRAIDGDNRADHSADAGTNLARYAQARAKDHGDFKLCYKPRTDCQKGIAGRRAGINQPGIECIIDSLNERIALPFDIVIVFQKCDGPDAFYDDTTHQITLCYDLIEDYYDLFSDKIKDKTKLDETVSSAITSIFFHEVGHALIDAWSLPITGKEEDAADQLSNLFLIEEMEGGEQMVLAGALTFKLYADLDGGEKPIYWDEHSLDGQRFYDTLCLIYGHDPEKYAYLIKDGTLPLTRAELCKDDYAKFKKSWQTLLAPFIKTPPNAASKIRMH